MPTEEELEQRVNEHIDEQEAKKAILKFEIEKMREDIKRMKGVTE